MMFQSENLSPISSKLVIVRTEDWEYVVEMTIERRLIHHDTLPIDTFI